MMMHIHMAMTPIAVVISNDGSDGHADAESD
jgi:hypothetical protein